MAVGRHSRLFGVGLLHGLRQGTSAICVRRGVVLHSSLYLSVTYQRRIVRAPNEAPIECLC
jgi:hypothetical protein